MLSLFTTITHSWYLLTGALILVAHAIHDPQARAHWQVVARCVRQMCISLLEILLRLLETLLAKATGSILPERTRQPAQEPQPDARAAPNAPSAAAEQRAHSRNRPPPGGETRAGARATDPPEPRPPAASTTVNHRRHAQGRTLAPTATTRKGQPQPPSVHLFPGTTGVVQSVTAHTRVYTGAARDPPETFIVLRAPVPTQTTTTAASVPERAAAALLPSKKLLLCSRGGIIPALALADHTEQRDVPKLCTLLLSMVAQLRTTLENATAASVWTTALALGTPACMPQDRTTLLAHLRDCAALLTASLAAAAEPPLPYERRIACACTLAKLFHSMTGRTVAVMETQLTPDQYFAMQNSLSNGASLTPWQRLRVLGTEPERLSYANGMIFSRECPEQTLAIAGNDYVYLAEDAAPHLPQTEQLAGWLAAHLTTAVHLATAATPTALTGPSPLGTEHGNLPQMPARTAQAGHPSLLSAGPATSPTLQAAAGAQRAPLPVGSPGPAGPAAQSLSPEATAALAQMIALHAASTRGGVSSPGGAVAGTTNRTSAAGPTAPQHLAGTAAPTPTGNHPAQLPPPHCQHISSLHRNNRYRGPARKYRCCPLCTAPTAPSQATGNRCPPPAPPSPPRPLQPSPSKHAPLQRPSPPPPVWFRGPRRHPDPPQECHRLRAPAPGQPRLGRAAAPAVPRGPP